ncbi:MAG TPA: FAD-dependent oxidoreductase [Flavobacteriales bacterium]|nr:FAD-dependent oxidoreductase [Flavobacteriales bacterium]HIN40123.1 FAD-dependent oxidoreductase [Flavobacteriales bacterium]HIO68457.1 FAD-dependent oxidoreductase [Flavobacteriales bacterium]
MEKKEVAIIGGGAIGLCAAYYLIKCGRQVTIIDQNPAADETSCSFGNAGLIVPSHLVPLAAPGVITKGLQWMLDAESPFYIKPRLNLELISWLWEFYKASSHDRVMQAAPILRDLNVGSKALLSEMSNDEHFYFEVEEKGLLILCKTQKYLNKEGKNAEMANQLGVRAEVLNVEQVNALLPSFEPAACGGVYYPDDAHIIPGDFMQELRKWLTSHGAEFISNLSVEALEGRNGKIEQLIAKGKKIGVSQVVLTSGAWTSLLLRSVGIKLPLQAGKGYNLTLPNPPKTVDLPLLLGESKVAVTPMGDSLRFAGTMEIAGIDLNINPKRIAGIKKAIKKYLPAFDDSWVSDVSPWAGLRPCTPDGLPYIGRSTAFNNLTVATGHAMLGLSLSPITGKLVSEIISEEKPSIDLSLLHPERFN